MPELPEIEHLRRSLEPFLVRATVVRARLHRADIAHRLGGPKRRRIQQRELLAGATISSLLRHGKNLAIVTHEGAGICVHLGMSGQLRFVPAGHTLTQSDHVHCVWRIAGPRCTGRLVFRDPRRFGGIWTFSSIDELQLHRWHALGPDAMSISASALGSKLRDGKRPIKAALLEQSLLAGVGNIYADEALFAAGIHPISPSRQIPSEAIDRLAGAIRRVMRQAVAAGGSTIRSYVDGNGQGGDYASTHRVYGRAGKPCLQCGRQLEHLRIAQRTTVFCPTCQKRYE